MKFVCKCDLKSANVNYDGGTDITFTTDRDFREAYSEFKEIPLRVTIEEYKDKRSLKANNYYWKLIGELAYVMQWSRAETHNRMLWEWGVPAMDGDDFRYAMIPNTEEARREALDSYEYHIMPTDKPYYYDEKGNCFEIWQVLLGSSHYNTKEMSRLIKGTIQECLAQDIPYSMIATPDELIAVKELYGIEL